MSFVRHFRDFGDFGRRKQLVPFICWRFLKPFKDPSNKVYNVWRHKSEAKKKQIWESRASLSVLLQPNAKTTQIFKAGKYRQKETPFVLGDASSSNFGLKLWSAHSPQNLFRPFLQRSGSLSYPSSHKHASVGNDVVVKETSLGEPISSFHDYAKWAPAILSKVTTPLTTLQPQVPIFKAYKK